MQSTNHQPNSTSRSHLPSHTRTPLSRSREASRFTVEDILYSAARTPRSRVSKDARRRRRRLQTDNNAQSGIPPSAAQLPLDVASNADLQATSLSRALQGALTRDVKLDTQAPQEPRDGPTTIKQSLPPLESRVLSPSSGNAVGRHTDENGHHDASQLDELDREILAIESGEQQFHSISTQPATIQDTPLEATGDQQALLSSQGSLTRNLKHPRNVPENVPQDLTHIGGQIHESSNQTSPLVKRRRQSTNDSIPKTNVQKRNGVFGGTRSQRRKLKSKGKDGEPKAAKKKRRFPDEGLSLGPYKDKPQFAEPDEDQEMILENDPIIVTQPSTPPSRKGRVNETELLKGPRKQKSKTLGRQVPTQKSFFSPIDPAKFALPLPYTSSPSVQAFTRKVPSYREGFEGSEARPTGNAIPIRKSRSRNPPVDPLALRMGRLTIVDSRSLREEISPSPKPRNPSPNAVMKMDDYSQLSATCQGTEDAVPEREVVSPSRTNVDDMGMKNYPTRSEITHTSTGPIRTSESGVVALRTSSHPKAGCFKTQQKPKRQVTFSNEVEKISDLFLPLHNLSAPARQVTISDEEDDSEAASDSEEDCSASGQGNYEESEQGEESEDMEDYDEDEEHSGRYDQVPDEKRLTNSAKTRSTIDEGMLLDTDSYERDSENSQKMSKIPITQRAQRFSTSSQRPRIVSESSQESRIAAQTGNSRFSSVTQQDTTNLREVKSNAVTTNTIQPQKSEHSGRIHPMSTTSVRSSTLNHLSVETDVMSTWRPRIPRNSGIAIEVEEDIDLLDEDRYSEEDEDSRIFGNYTSAPSQQMCKEKTMYDNVARKIDFRKPSSELGDPERLASTTSTGPNMRRNSEQQHDPFRFSHILIQDSDPKFSTCQRVPMSSLQSQNNTNKPKRVIAQQSDYFATASSHLQQPPTRSSRSLSMTPSGIPRTMDVDSNTNVGSLFSRPESALLRPLQTFAPNSRIGGLEGDLRSGAAGVSGVGVPDLSMQRSAGRTRSLPFTPPFKK